jgi:hypothetical protein
MPRQPLMIDRSHPAIAAKLLITRPLSQAL